MENKIVEIPFADLPRLKKLYKVEWPIHMSSYCVIDTCIRWLTQNPDLKCLKVLSLNGDWETCGTFVVIRGTSLFLNTLEESCEKLKTLLSLIDLSEPYLISSLEERLKSVAEEALKRQKITTLTGNPTIFYYLSNEEASELELETPKEIFLKPLVFSNAAQIYENWNNKHEDSIDYIKTLIEYNSTIGAYTEDDELIAWCFRLETGDLSILQVEEKYFRKGYGTLVTVALAKKFADLGYDSSATILPGNSASQQLFENLGFRRIYDTHWIWTGPKP